MRLSPEQQAAIRRIVADVAGSDAQVRLFGSRLDDSARGGDVDLFVTLERPVEQPALVSAQLSARISRHLQGRRVDVILSAPNLRTLPIHDVARREGVLL
ncbi:Nucleotidyltransferase domain-containing protein [Ectothiorhodospira mobilis]|uniref:Nucleotidyltransferase domain-containing protein n=1 Tax=Ectothiorhodospira mobilis TaxID=195064 RepID=A0A1I4PW63_ECTMO|nr:nucleotidyltransferase domain-containing protein [Ectothiorhodospira mobilis]SFM31693.1 Nucleotidyltransferase domain-containing protein [Ectothiorhodospira mobilis]